MSARSAILERSSAKQPGISTIRKEKLISIRDIHPQLVVLGLDVVLKIRSSKQLD